jgi:hypothetical protein
MVPAVPNAAGTSPTVLVRRAGEQRFTEPAVTGYANEPEMQDILFSHPTLLPGIEDPAIACREFQSGAGPADVVVLDGSGSLMITECKLAQNPQVRREVVGQVIDYVSRIWRMPVADFEQRWVQRTGRSPFDAFGDGGTAVRQGLAASLESGRFTVVLAVDGINDDLRRMVEYLNTITVPDVQVLAFEVARVRHDDIEILLPRVFGAELATLKTSSQPSWTEAQFLDGLNNRSAELSTAMRQLVAEAHSLDLPITNGTASEPSLIVGSIKDGTPVWSLSLFSGGPYGLSALFRLDRFIDHDIDAGKAAAILQGIPGVTPDLPALKSSGYRRWVKIPMESLRSTDARQLLFHALLVTDQDPGSPAS